MACFTPLKAIRGLIPNAAGKYPVRILGKGNPDYDQATLDLPCGKCIGCRVEYSRQWAIRCMHEEQYTRHKGGSAFITLTYDDAHLPEAGICKSHVQSFLKRLRHKTPKITYYLCGEYGDLTHRPHYHILLFGYDFPDRVLYSRNPQGSSLFTSEVLDESWQHQGRALIGEVTFESAAYVARYVMKKRKGKDSKLGFIDPETGEQKPGEFCLMSRNPAIGKRWFEENKKEVFPSDTVVVNGREQSPPKYYLGQYEIIDPEAVSKLKEARIARMNKTKKDRTPARLEARKKVMQSKLKNKTKLL